MSTREPIGAKLRFEVFKRDNFTCQYCGKKAPDVVLHVDHINPVSAGGKSDILNLVTACAGCNLGKGARLLTDRSEIEKQRAQLEDLNERRQQLEWMLEWRQELENVEDDRLDALEAAWHRYCVGWTVNETGRRSLAKWEKKFGTELLLDAIKASAEQYLEYDEDKATEESVAHAFSMIPRVAGGIRSTADRPYMRDIYYCRAVLRNRLRYVNERQVVGMLEEAILLGADPEKLRHLCKTVRSWSQFAKTISDFISEEHGENDE